MLQNSETKSIRSRRSSIKSINSNIKFHPNDKNDEESLERVYTFNLKNEVKSPSKSPKRNDLDIYKDILKSPKANNKDFRIDLKNLKNKNDSQNTHPKSD